MITQEMLDEFNATMKVNGSVVRLKFGGWGCGTVETALSSYMFVDSVILNLENDFYIMLEEFFKSKGIEIKYNNTRSRFWEN